jgi:predicted patatin/cPLA2 family phospholipase
LTLPFNPIILEEEDYHQARNILYATSSTIPLTKAPKINGKYYIDGGYTKNSPLKSIFMNTDVKSILLIDFTNYREYDNKFDRCYSPNPMRFFDNFLEMQELSLQISFDACNKTQLESALFLNNLISQLDQQVLKVKNQTYVYKEIFTLKPENLEMNPLHPRAKELAWEYYKLGKTESEKLLRG